VYHIRTLTDISFGWYEDGMEFITPAFVSTSELSNLNWPGNCMWEITLKKGARERLANVMAWSEYPTEHEILICCYTRFKVLSKQTNFTDKHGKVWPYYVQLEFLDK